MNRQEWEFEYTAAKLADAARKQRDYRESRVVFWKEKYAEVMKEVREAGIEVSESVAAGVSNTYSTKMVGPQVMVRHDLQTKLTECHSKVQEHERASREYNGWAQVLDANPETRLRLHHDDWLYFFGK